MVKNICLLTCMLQSAVKTICVELQKLASMVGKAKNMSAIHLPPPIIKDYIEVYIFLFVWITLFAPRKGDYGTVLIQLV